MCHVLRHIYIVLLNYNSSPCDVPTPDTPQWPYSYLALSPNTVCPSCTQYMYCTIGLCRHYIMHFSDQCLCTVHGTCIHTCACTSLLYVPCKTCRTKYMYTCTHVHACTSDNCMYRHFTCESTRSMVYANTL